MNANLLDQVRTQAAWVANEAINIKIEYDKIEAYALSLPLDKIENPPLDPTAHYLGRGRDTLAFFLTLETINFGSGFFPSLQQDLEESGYFTVSRALTNYFIQNGAIPAEKLATISAKECTHIFQQSKTNIAIQELMQLFSKALNQLGRFLLEKFDGKFEALIESANHSAIQLVDLLIQIPCFYDVSTYKNQQVPLLKRAQITVADISLAFKNEGLGYFSDLDQLTIFADNMVPHVLRMNGILTYNEHLSNIVDNELLLASGSIEEVEIRACAIHTVELLKQALHKLGHPVKSVDLDYLIWNLGLTQHHPTFKLHLTKSTFY